MRTNPGLKVPHTVVATEISNQACAGDFARGSQEHSARFQDLLGISPSFTITLSQNSAVFHMSCPRASQSVACTVTQATNVITIIAEIQTEGRVFDILGLALYFFCAPHAHKKRVPIDYHVVNHDLIKASLHRVQSHIAKTDIEYTSTDSKGQRLLYLAKQASTAKLLAVKITNTPQSQNCMHDAILALLCCRICFHNFAILMCSHAVHVSRQRASSADLLGETHTCLSLIRLWFTRFSFKTLSGLVISESYKCKVYVPPFNRTHTVRIQYACISNSRGYQTGTARL